MIPVTAGGFSFWVLSLSSFLSSAQVSRLLHNLSYYPPLGFPFFSLPSLLPVSLFSSCFSSPSSLSSASPHASSSLFLLFCSSGSWVYGLSPALVVSKKSSTTRVAFYDCSSCLTMVGNRRTVIAHCLWINTCSCFNIVQSNMTWWTTILNCDL